MHSLLCEVPRYKLLCRSISSMILSYVSSPYRGVVDYDQFQKMRSGFRDTFLFQNDEMWRLSRRKLILSSRLPHPAPSSTRCRHRHGLWHGKHHDVSRILIHFSSPDNTCFVDFITEINTRFLLRGGDRTRRGVTLPLSLMCLSIIISN